MIHRIVVTELIGHAAVGTIVMAMAVIVLMIDGLSSRNANIINVRETRHLGMKDRHQQCGRDETDQYGHAEARKYPRVLLSIMFHTINSVPEFIALDQIIDA